MSENTLIGETRGETPEYSKNTSTISGSAIPKPTYNHIISDIEFSQKLLELGAIDYNALEYQVKGLMGEVLTLIDSITSNEQQNKAQKDMVRYMFRKKLDWLKRICYGEHAGLSNIDNIG